MITNPFESSECVPKLVIEVSGRGRLKNAIKKQCHEMEIWNTVLDKRYPEKQGSYCMPLSLLRIPPGVLGDGD